MPVTLADARRGRHTRPAARPYCVGMRGRRRLIHLNGAPGIGKSTLAARYAAEHPGTMAVELDTLRTWVGGWREADHDLLPDVRSAGFALASAWLESGHDVVLPQLVARADHIDWLREVAERAGADLVELVLLGERHDVVRRFDMRRAQGAPDHVADVVMPEDAELLAYHDALETGAASWPAAVAVPSRAGDLEQTYTAVLAALS